MLDINAIRPLQQQYPTTCGQTVTAMILGHNNEEGVCYKLAQLGIAGPNGYKGTRARDRNAVLNFFRPAQFFQPSRSEVFKIILGTGVPHSCVVTGHWQSLSDTRQGNRRFNYGHHAMLKVGNQVFDPGTGSVREWTANHIQTFGSTDRSFKWHAFCPLYFINP